jgi:hypothetical protein
MAVLVGCARPDGFVLRSMLGGLALMQGAATLSMKKAVEDAMNQAEAANRSSN